IFVGKTLCPNRIAGDEDRNIINTTEAGFQSATGVETRRLLRANRKIIDQHLGRRITQFFDDLLTSGFFLQGQESAQWILVAHVLGKTVENTAHFHDCAGSLDFIAKNLRAVRRGKNGLARIESHLAAIDIKSGNYFDVLRLVRADATVHEAGTASVAVGPAVKIDSLDERTGTVAHSDDSDSDFAHSVSATLCAVRSRAQVTSFRFSMVRPSLT